MLPYKFHQMKNNSLSKLYQTLQYLESKINKLSHKIQKEYSHKDHKHDHLYSKLYHEHKEYDTKYAKKDHIHLYTPEIMPVVLPLNQTTMQLRVDCDEAYLLPYENDIVRVCIQHNKPFLDIRYKYDDNQHVPYEICILHWKTIKSIQKEGYDFQVDPVDSYRGRKIHLNSHLYHDGQPIDEGNVDYNLEE